MSIQHQGHPRWKLLVKTTVTLSASPASQTSCRIDPDEAKVLLSFQEYFLCSWNPFGSWGGSHGVLLGYIFARREVITPARLQALLLDLMAQEWKGLHQSLRKLQPICCSLPQFNQPRVERCLCPGQSVAVFLTMP